MYNSPSVPEKACVQAYPAFVSASVIKLLILVSSSMIKILFILYTSMPALAEKIATFFCFLTNSFIPAGNEPSAVLARAFGECREGQIPRSSAAHQA